MFCLYVFFKLSIGLKGLITYMGCRDNAGIMILIRDNFICKNLELCLMACLKMYTAYLTCSGQFCCIESKLYCANLYGLLLYQFWISYDQVVCGFQACFCVDRPCHILCIYSVFALKPFAVIRTGDLCFVWKWSSSTALLWNLLQNMQYETLAHAF